MRVKNSYLYWGVFLLALGGAIAVVNYVEPDATAVVDVLRLWPLVVIALGVALVLRRSRYNVAGGVLAAAVPGLLLGGTLALGPQVGLDCAPKAGEQTSFDTNQGAFTAPARVDVATGCGTLIITTRPGSGWDLRAANTHGYAPVVAASANDLSLRSVRDDRWFGEYGRDAWGLTLPTSRIDDLDVVINAGAGQANLDGADIGALALTTNAGRSTVDLATAQVETIAAAVNAGQLSIDLPAGDDVRGTISVNAGDADVCVPDTVGLRVHSSGAFSSTDLNGLALHDGAWESPDYASAAHHADLTVSVNLGSLDINPVGGCS
jgi:hypothetical protein